MNRYQDIEILRNNTGNRYFKTNFYPEIPLSESDIYVIVDDADRYDLLASQYYGDATLWWIISIANQKLPQNTMMPPAGTVIRIPINITSILLQYSNINRF